MPTEAEAPPLASITTHLRGVHYPADRDALLRCAEEDKAPAPLVAIIRQIPDQLYGGVAEVSRALEAAIVRQSERWDEAELVDEASQESFPASDPPAYATGGRIGKPRGKDDQGDDQGDDQDAKTSGD